MQKDGPEREATNPSIHWQQVLGIAPTAGVAAMLETHCRTVCFPAGQAVLWAGEESTHLYYILKGLVRGYYMDENGSDVTKCFCAEGEVFCTEGYRVEGAASFSIECLEPCVCIAVPYTLLHAVVEADVGAAVAVSRLFGHELGRQEEKNRQLLLLPANERYTHFCKNFPTLHGRVALKHIASYIGVRPASLSRIRKMGAPFAQ